jgi:hypothetical protein
MWTSGTVFENLTAGSKTLRRASKPYGGLKKLTAGSKTLRRARNPYGGRRGNLRAGRLIQSSNGYNGFDKRL